MPGKKQHYSSQGDTRPPRVATAAKRQDQQEWRLVSIEKRLMRGGFTPTNLRELNNLEVSEFITVSNMAKELVVKYAPQIHELNMSLQAAAKAALAAEAAKKKPVPLVPLSEPAKQKPQGRQFQKSREQKHRSK